MAIMTKQLESFHSMAQSTVLQEMKEPLISPTQQNCLQLRISIRNQISIELKRCSTRLKKNLRNLKYFMEQLFVRLQRLSFSINNLLNFKIWIEVNKWFSKQLKASAKLLLKTLDHLNIIWAKPNPLALKEKSD